jgi:hypothetical protein
VSPLTASAFDLPGRLAAKASPALIAGDEQHFAAIAESAVDRYVAMTRATQRLVILTSAQG